MTTPGSGNRWEPAAGATQDETAPLPVDHDPAEPRDAPADESRPRLRLVGLAAAFLLLGGVAGFLVGRTAAGNDTEVGRFSQLDHHGPASDFGDDGFGHDDDGGPR